MLKITKDKFESFVLSSTNATSEVFDMITQELQDAECNLSMYVLGDDVYRALGTYNEKVVKECEKFVCLFAFKNAMPSLDLVLTPTGFGVVSNQNTVPASSDRVAKLATSIANSLDYCEENIYVLLRGDKVWSESLIAKRVFSTTMWHSRILRVHGYPGANLTLLRTKNVVIATAEEQIKKSISPEFFEELCTSLRLNTQTELQELPTILIQKAICCLIDANQLGYTLQITSLLKFLDNNISEFETYKNSSAFEANHFIPYENEKEDSCFFWG